MNGNIHLRNMVFYGHHGHLAEENALGQRFVVDIVLSLDIGEAVASDRLEHTVNYATVFSLCRGIVEGERFKLLEALAGRIIDRVLAECPRVNRVEIVVKKPAVPLPGALDYVAVEAAKSRD